MTWETQYLNLLEKVINGGTIQHNRTGIDTLRVEGAHMQINLQQGFPAVTTKQLAFKQVKGEMLGFIRGYSNAAQFRNLSCSVWDQNANENQQWLNNPNREGTDDLGRIYGVQWRDWDGMIDQLHVAIQKIIHTPEDRRIIVSAWNPSELSEMSLPPCHVMHQYICDPQTKEISLCMYQRSCDMFLGIPFNVAGYALLLELVARATGYRAKMLNMFLADVHIYTNHLDQVKEQLSRKPFDTPRLWVDPQVGAAATGLKYLEMTEPHHILLDQYYFHPAIKAPMAV